MLFEATFLGSNGKLTNILQAKTYKAIASCPPGRKPYGLEAKPRAF